MIEQPAIVVRGDDRVAWVRPEATTGCGGCTSSSCGVALVARLFGRKGDEMRVRNEAGVVEGDRVVIAITESVFLKALAVAYAIPLFGFLAGGMIGMAVAARLALASPDLAAAVGALGGLFTAMAWARGQASRLLDPGAEGPVAIRKIVAPEARVFPQ